MDTIIAGRPPDPCAKLVGGGPIAPALAVWACVAFPYFAPSSLFPAVVMNPSSFRTILGAFFTPPPGVAAEAAKAGAAIAGAGIAGAGVAGAATGVLVAGGVIWP
jgi:hypothetical protein